MRSSIGWALLGLVIERPSYGYELLQRFQRTYGETLVLSGSARIYTALATLQTHALIEEVTPPLQVVQDAKFNRQPKPHYRATPSGVRAYQEWLVGQIEEERRRQRVFVRQLAMLEPESALSVIDRYEQECLDDARKAEDEAPQSAAGVADRLAAEEAQLALEVRMSWIEYAREELSALLEGRDEGSDEPDEEREP
jgi:DNA-binding PadR family transcriptional regulator